MRKYNAIKMLFNMPVEYIVADDNFSMTGHFAGYDEEGYGYVFTGGSDSISQVSTKIKEQVVRCRFIKALTTVDQGVHETNMTTKLLDKYGYNIVKDNNGIYRHIDTTGLNEITTTKNSGQRVASIKLEINDPVKYITNKDNGSKIEIGHFAGYDIDNKLYVYELGGTSYTRNIRQVIECEHVFPLMVEHGKESTLYNKHWDLFNSTNGCIVDKDNLKLIL